MPISTAEKTFLTGLRVVIFNGNHLCVNPDGWITRTGLGGEVFDEHLDIKSLAVLFSDSESEMVFWEIPTQ
jgi:hypothetical protein